MSLVVMAETSCFDSILGFFFLAMLNWIILDADAQLRMSCYLRQMNGVRVNAVFVRCVCVRARSGPVNQTSLKHSKLGTSNLTRMFPGTVRT